MKNILIPLLMLSGIAAADDTEILIQFGLGDKESTVWDGSITVTPGESELVWLSPMWIKSE